jgi:hypothetical protein
MLLLKRIFLVILMQQFALLIYDIKSQNIGSEIAYLQTDRSVYIAGESIYYKLYVLDAATRKCSSLSKVGYIVLRAPNWPPSLKILVKIDASMANGSIALPDTLTSGVYQIVAYTSVMKNGGEESLFHKEITIANRFDKALDFKLIKPTPKDTSLKQLQDVKSIIKTDKVVYGIREKVVVNLGKTNSKAKISVSVFEEPKLPSKDKSMVEVLNGLSLHQKSKHSSIYYSPETKGKILRGIVVDANTQETIKDEIVLMSCVDTIPNLQYAVTNSNGLFQMLLSDYYNGKELFLTIRNVPENKNWKIKIEDEFDQSEKWTPSLISNNTNYKEYLVKSQNIVYINKSYQLNKNVEEKLIVESKSICPQLYHCPVITILPSDFVSLPDFFEIAVELLPDVRIVKDNKNKLHAQVTDRLLKIFNPGDPAIYLDGVFVDDINKIMTLGSEQIKKIEVIDAEIAFGDLTFNGVISITSKSKDMISAMPAMPYSLRLKNDNLNTSENLVTFNPNTLQNKYIPFIKQLLYWNPNVELNETDDTKIEFYTSDNLAKYSIHLEGIAEDGTPISASTRIQVTNK